MADEEAQTQPQGWYQDPFDATKLRYWNGSQWTDELRARGTPARAADRSWIRAPGRVRLPVWFWLLLIVATLGILWGAAEQHDQGCYNKTRVQAASGNTSQSNCLLLPWNDPAEGPS